MSDPQQATIDQAEAQANSIRRYWESFGAHVQVTVRMDRWAGYSVRVQLDANGLPLKWVSKKHRAAYLFQQKQGWRHLVRYLNEVILPPHNAFRRDDSTL